MRGPLRAKLGNIVPDLSEVPGLDFSEGFRPSEREKLRNKATKPFVMKNGRKEVSNKSVQGSATSKLVTVASMPIMV